MTAEPRLRIQVYQDLEGLQELLPAWDELLRQIPTASIFSTPEWLAPWWRAFGGGEELQVLAFHDSSSTLTGLAALSIGAHMASGIRLRQLRLMGDGSGDSDNLDMPVIPGYEERVAAALLDHLQSGAVSWDFCKLNRMADDSTVGNQMLRLLKTRGWTYSSFLEPRTVISLPDTWEAYRQQLSYNERGQLGKYTRRLEKKYGEVRFYRCEDEAQLEACLDQMFRLHQMRWQSQGEAGSFASAARRQFYSEMARALLRRKRLEFWLLDLDGKTVGAEFDFRYGDTVYSLQGGFDPAHAGDRVGYVLRGHVLKTLITDGVHRYDFLFGQGGYKERWAADTRSYLSVHFARPWTRGSLYLRAVRQAGETKEWLRGHLPQPAWRVLQILNARLAKQQRSAQPTS